MSKRYGRKQKRKHREQIEALKNHQDFLLSRIRMEAHRADQAKQKALDHFMNHSGLMELAVKRIAYELGRAVGKELEPHARKLFDSAHRHYNVNPIEFSVHNHQTHKEFETIRGEVKALCYNVVVG